MTVNSIYTNEEYWIKPEFTVDTNGLILWLSSVDYIPGSWINRSSYGVTNNGYFVNDEVRTNNDNKGLLGTHVKLSSSLSRYVGITDNSSLNLTGAITLAGWFRITNPNKINQQIGRGTAFITTGGPYGYKLAFYDANNLTFETYGHDILNPANVIRDRVLYSLTPLPTSAGEWTFVAGTWDGTTNANSKKLYIEKTLVSQKTPITYDIVGPATEDFYIGRAGNNPLDGLMDSDIAEIYLYNRALTDIELINLRTKSAIYYARYNII